MILVFRFQNNFLAVYVLVFVPGSFLTCAKRHGRKQYLRFCNLCSRLPFSFAVFSFPFLPCIFMELGSDSRHFQAHLGPKISRYTFMFSQSNLFAYVDLLCLISFLDCEYRKGEERCHWCYGSWGILLNSQVSCHKIRIIIVIPSLDTAVWAWSCITAMMFIKWWRYHLWC